MAWMPLALTSMGNAPACWIASTTKSTSRSRQSRPTASTSVRWPLANCTELRATTRVLGPMAPSTDSGVTAPSTASISRTRTPRSARCFHGKTLDGYSMALATATSSPERQSSPPATIDRPWEVLFTNAISPGEAPMSSAVRARASATRSHHCSDAELPRATWSSSQVLIAARTSEEPGATAAQLR